MIFAYKKIVPLLNKSLLVIITLLLVSIGMNISMAMAGAQHYEADMNSSQWDTTSSIVECTLAHKIPFYGKAEFVRRAGKKLFFRIFVEEIPRKKGKATLRSNPPNWKHNTDAKKLGELTYKAGEKPFLFNRTLSLRVLAELEQGMQPTVYFRNLDDKQDEVSVSLSTVNFMQSLSKFRQCNGKLLPFDFETAKNMELYFDTDKYNLTEEARRRLDTIIAYMNLMPSVKTATIEGHADYRGTHPYNDVLSNRRAVTVREYMKERKIPEARINLRYFGKRKPAASNKTRAGMAKNRRVRVRLIE